MHVMKANDVGITPVAEVEVGGWSGDRGHWMREVHYPVLAIHLWHTIHVHHYVPRTGKTNMSVITSDQQKSSLVKFNIFGEIVKFNIH